MEKVGFGLKARELRKKVEKRPIFCFRIRECIFYSIFWGILPIKYLILLLESGSKKKSMLLRTSKISLKQMCEGLLVHPV
jgi:hypothetical protein